MKQGEGGGVREEDVIHTYWCHLIALYSFLFSFIGTIPGRFDLTSFGPGSHTLVVNGLVTGTNTMLMSGTITFSGAQCKY